MLRRTPLRRRRWMQRGRRTTTYARRERDVDYMLRVKRLACSARVDPPNPDKITPCRGRVEADHMGERGIGQKCDDRETAPMCQAHHDQRSTHSGAFAALTRGDVRVWRARQVERTQREVDEMLAEHAREAVA